MPTKTWADGDVLTASDLNTYVRDQWITICTSGTRPTTSVDGRPIYETDTDRFYIWDTTASAWQNWTWLGAWTSWTPAFTQSATPTLTNNESKYTRIGRTVIAECAVSFTSSGTASNQIVCSIPVTAAFTANKACGSFWFNRGGTYQAGTVILASSTQLKFISQSATDTMGVSPAITISSGDTCTFTVTYEAAAG